MKLNRYDRDWIKDAAIEGGRRVVYVRFALAAYIMAIMMLVVPVFCRWRGRAGWFRLDWRWERGGERALGKSVGLRVCVKAHLSWIFRNTKDVGMVLHPLINNDRRIIFHYLSRF